jgi:hypothetical protein
MKNTPKGINPKSELSSTRTIAQPPRQVKS